MSSDLWPKLTVFPLECAMSSYVSAPLFFEVTSAVSGSLNSRIFQNDRSLNTFKLLVLSLCLLSPMSGLLHGELLPIYFCFMSWPYFHISLYIL